MTPLKSGDKVQVIVNRKERWFSFYLNDKLQCTITEQSIDDGDLHFGFSTARSTQEWLID